MAGELNEPTTMGRHKLYGQDPKKIRNALNEAVDLARAMQEIERELMRRLAEIDRKRWYVRLGVYSLRGFCESCLRLPRPQAQRIARGARRAAEEHPASGPSSESAEPALGDARSWIKPSRTMADWAREKAEQDDERLQSRRAQTTVNLGQKRGSHVGLPIGLGNDPSHFKGKTGLRGPFPFA